MKKWMTLLLCIVCASVLALSACSANTQETAASSAAYAEDSAARDSLAAPQAAGGDGGYEVEAVYEESEGGVSGISGEADFSADTANMPDTDRKLVYSASFELETAKYEQDYNAILQKLKEVNGYVEYESTQGTPPERTDYYGRTSYLTVRVPVENFEAFFTSVSGVGRVVSQSRNTDDVTSSYFDTEARIELLENRRDRLMGYIEEATDPEDIIVYERELSDVLYELDQYQGQKRQMDDMVDYTTIEISLQEIVVAADVPVDENGLPVGERAGDAFSKSMTGVGQFMENFAVGFAAAAPVLILLVIIAVVVLVIMKLVRFLRKKYGKPKAKKQPAPNPYYGGQAPRQPGPGQQRPPMPQGQPPQASPVQKPQDDGTGKEK